MWELKSTFGHPAGYDNTDMTGSEDNSTRKSDEGTQQGSGNNARRRRPRRRSRRRAASPNNNQSLKKSSTETPKNQPEKKKNNKRKNSRRSHSRPQSHQNRRHNKSRQTKLVTRNETSAGGLVISGLAEAVQDDGSLDLTRIYVALIGRLDRRGRLLWSMPKGHVEPGEEHGSTAEREVWEETGISGKVIEELGVIDYWFVSDGIRIHKTVHHHLLRFVDGELNDQDPEVTEVAWIPFSELIERLAYADERKLARQAHDLLPALAQAEKAAGRSTPR